jgi:hypothetical protein
MEQDWHAMEDGIVDHPMTLDCGVQYEDHEECSSLQQQREER